MESSRRVELRYENYRLVMGLSVVFTYRINYAGNLISQLYELRHRCQLSELPLVQVIPRVIPPRLRTVASYQ